MSQQYAEDVKYKVPIICKRERMNNGVEVDCEKHQFHRGQSDGKLWQLSRGSSTMPGRRTGQEKRTVYGQMYNICGSRTLAAWFSLSPVLSQSDIAMSDRGLT
jgi:hypothetical protein